MDGMSFETLRDPAANAREHRALVRSAFYNGLTGDEFVAQRMAERCERTCEHCGETFFARNPAYDQRYCSHACSAFANRALSDEQVRAIRVQRAARVPLKTLARQYGTSLKTIWNAATGSRTYADVPDNDDEAVPA